MKKRTKVRERKFKVGEIVYLKGVGFPHNRTDDGHETWEGASGVVAPNPAMKGATGRSMVYVRAFRPIKVAHDSTMDATFFHPEQVRREDRPWLRKHLRSVFHAQAEMAKLRDKLIALLPESP